jgi:predicted secreted protein
MYRYISIWILALPDICLKFVFNDPGKYKTQVEATNSMLKSFNKWFLSLNSLNEICVTEEHMLKELETSGARFEKLIHEMIQL